MNRPDFVLTNVPLAPYTTFKIGGTADFFAPVTTEEELMTVCSWAEDCKLPIMVLGGGSNLVFADAGRRGVVIAMQLRGRETLASSSDILVHVAAGEPWDELVSFSVDQGWWGLENLSAIPGSVGAAPIQNIGAYGVEVGELIESVRVYDQLEHQFKDIPASACRFGYRDSIFKHAEGQGLIVTAVRFRLTTTPNPNLQYPDVVAQLGTSNPKHPSVLRDTIVSIRSAKFPDLTKVGTAGSFFKNPIVSQGQFIKIKLTYPNLTGHIVPVGIKIPAAWLIDHVAKSRGIRVGDVGSHKKQALVFVNYGSATASELDSFANNIVKRIQSEVGIELEREVKFVLEN